MNSNGNQRKRGGRLAKNANANEKSPLQNIENNEVMEVASVAISPKLEESETATNAPTAECRRSSRKKIIKFDVRDLLNKNRKTHKIQIEARIDSNAPSTSKTATTGGIETANSKTSLMAREDLLSKQKTFLEKSAIFRRYSISQDHKPPPPLPIPPLLGKANDGRDAGLSANSSSRRLSRTQEFFSNVMIKPKQTASLIVAQIESNAPCSVAAAKRKALCKPTELETKVISTSETDFSPVIQQKKRGRPTKMKTQTSVETFKTTALQEESAKKKITPEKAKNWKEYKACIAQQGSSNKLCKTEYETLISPQYQKDPACILVRKQDEEKIVDDALQSDISRSDDDGNFSGFQTSKDDNSCDSPVLTKIYLDKDTCNKQSLKSPQYNENINNEDTIKFVPKSSTELIEKESTSLTETDKTLDTSSQIIDSNQNGKEKRSSIIPAKIPFEEKRTQNIPYKEDFEVKFTDTEKKDIAKVEPEFTTKKFKSQEEIKIIDNDQTESKLEEDVDKIILKKNENSRDVNIIKSQLNLIEEKTVKSDPNENTDEFPDVQKDFFTDPKEPEIVDINYKQPIRNNRRQLSKKDTKYLLTHSVEINNEKATTMSPILKKNEPKTTLESNEFNSEKIPTKSEETSGKSHMETVHETEREREKLAEECTPYTKLTMNDILLLTNQIPSQSSTPSCETKSFSCTSSSSESENAFEQSSYSSEPFSTTSSSSPRSYKSGDKLKVSVKRISLPKSPSTSSQTSTSEELNNSIVLKKPPMAKRSKRLQKNVAETIDDCFEKIPINANKEQQNLDEQIKIETIALSFAENKAEKCAVSSKEVIKEDKSSGLVEKVGTITEDTTHDSYESNVASEITDSASNESSNVGCLTGKEKIFKRKSLRNRRDNRSSIKDEKLDKPKSRVKEEPPEKENEEKEQSLFNIQDTKQQKLLLNESQKDKEVKQILENAQEKPTKEEQHKLLSNESGKNKHEKQILEKAPENPINVEQHKLLSNDSEKYKQILEDTQKQEAIDNNRKPSISLEDQNLRTDKVVDSTTIEKKEEKNISLSTEDKLDKTNKIITKVQAIEACDSTSGRTKYKTSKAVPTKNLTNKDGICIDELKIQAEIHDDLEVIDTKLKEPSTQSSPKHNAEQKHVSISEEIEVESVENTRNKASFVIKKSTKTDQEKNNKLTSTRSTPNKKQVSISISKPKIQDEKLSEVEKETCLKDIDIPNSSQNTTVQKNDVIQVETPEINRSRIKSPSSNGAGKISSTKSITNIDEIPTTDLSFQNKKLTDDEIEKTKFSEHSEQSSKGIAESTHQDKPKSPCEKTIPAFKDVKADKPEEARNITSIINKISNLENLPKEAKNEEKSLNLVENDESLKKNSRKHKKEATIPKVLNVESLDNSQGKNNIPNEKPTTPDEDVKASKSEKTIKTRSKSNKEEITSIESGKHVKYPTQDEVSTINDLKKEETAEAMTDRNKSPKEELFITDNQLTAAKISLTRSKTNKEEISTKERKVSEKATLKDKETKKTVKNVKEAETNTTTHCNKSVLPTDKPMSVNKEDLGLTKSKPNKEKISPITPKSTTQEASDSPKVYACLTENTSSSIRNIVSEMLIENSKSSQDTKLAIENKSTEESTATEVIHHTKPHSPAKISPKAASVTKIIPCKHSESTKTFSELASKLRVTDKYSEAVKPIKETSTTNEQQDNTSQENKEPIVVAAILTKRRGRRSRFKNLHGPELDSETDNSNEKNMSVNETTLKKLKTETKTTQKEQVEGKEIETQQTFLEKDTNNCEAEKQLTDVSFSEETVSHQENSQTNLLSSQIKNVSIETNTLLDILRTVQSNTEAALKATKSPTNIDEKDNENSIDSTTKMQFEQAHDLLKIEQKSKTTSPTQCDAQSPITAKKMNLSPARSDSASPLTLKKVISSPTRSDSSSPLTLKKVMRRYERRSRRGEDSAHKTLEETFAEIAAQSSKAVLAAKEFGIDEKTTDEKFPKELDDNNTGPNIEKEQIQENEDFKKSTDLEIMPSKPVKKDDEILLNVFQVIDKTPDISKEGEIYATENVVEIEANKVTPARRGRKPKNRVLEVSMTVAKETLDVKNLPTAKTESIITKEVVHEIQIETKSVEAAKQETLNENKTNTTTKPDVIQETTQAANLPDDKSESLLYLLTDQKTDAEESPNLTQTTVKVSLKPLEDICEGKSNKKCNKKRDTKTVMEDSALLSNVVTCKDIEDEEVRTPKQATKKRDASLCKTETKSVCKKQMKKTKNEEEDSFNLEKEDSLIKTAATTPPPSKRGRKPKNQQPETPQHSTSSKKKNQKGICVKSDEEDINVEKGKLLESKCEYLNVSVDKSLDEKLAKKKRQKKLKEAFEAALTDDIEKSNYANQTETSSPTSNSSFGLTLFNNSPPPEESQTIPNEDINEAIKLNCITPVETEEDPDPLKDIEKFIADGVNLLKKDYKLDEDSVDDVIKSKPKTTEILEEPVKTSIEEEKLIFNVFETPADTPLNTPSATPPPKSPTAIELSTPDENSGVRRSHRIKLITKTPKALVGRGLVRDKERFSIKDDVETKSHYTLDDHLTDLAEVEAKNAKFLKEMEERLSNFQVIKENDYLCERVISREARKMICDCFLTHGEEERGELGCGEDCLNRLLMIECGLECNVKERCTNKRFQKLLCSPCRVFRTEKKGFGIMADIEILPGEFIMEYVGEVIDTEEFEKRRVIYSQDKNRHYYFMALRSDAIIDATIKGNISRFINHSCDPNAETQKWTVNGELRIGFFSRKSIMPGEEITFNYQYQRYGREAQRCYCESANCRGWIGQEPTSDEGEQMDDDDEEDESEEEEADTSNLLVQDDDEDSDASVVDPEEVQKQLEMAAAQAEVELAPLQLLEQKNKQVEITADEGKLIQDLNKSGNEEDSKSKFKKLLSKMAEKVAAKQKQKRQQKLHRKKKLKESSSELANKLRFLEDPDIEDEVQFLKECGLKNQSDTLRLSRLMVRAKLVQTRLNLLEILRKGDFPCRRLFLDYHGLRLLHGWMSEDAGNMQIRLSLLQTLETLPIANKTVLTDSKVMQVVRNWCGTNTNLSPIEDSSSSNSNSQDIPVQGSTNFEQDSEMAELKKLAFKLITTWEGLPEIFRIPKKERIEQMKEHEREADRQYAANAEAQENTTASNRYRRDRFGRGLNTSNNVPSTSNRFVKPNNGNPHRTANTTPENIKNLSKAQRRKMFAAKVARDEAEKRLAEERREFETKCRFFGLDPKKTRVQDIPFCVNPTTGQWFSIERKPITTPPSYAHVQVPVKPKSTDPNDYQLPAICSSLPPHWKYAITPQGKIYYYHVKHRIPQWEPPSVAQLQQCDQEAREEDSESELTSTAGEDSSDDDDDILVGMDPVQLKAYIDRKVEMRRQKRYQRLVDERSISPRREEDRIYNQIEVRKYKENKEKIRKRKEEIRRKRAEVLRQTSLNMCTLGSISDSNQNSNTNKLNTESDEELGALPIQDYLLSSDEEVDIKAEVNSPLIDKIVEGDKIVDELDALTTKRQLKRPLPPHRDLNECSTSSSSISAAVSVPNTVAAKQEYKKRKLEKKEKRKPKEQDAKYRKNKEKFRCEIAGIIVHHLKPYLKETCNLGRIQSNEDFNHLARKLTHFVMIKELKYCESVGQTLVVTESVKSKSREFIKKYMAKYGDVYVKPTNDPDFKDIPFTL